MNTNPRFHIGERVQASIDNCPLEGVGKVRQIECAASIWRYAVEPEEPGDFVWFQENELGPVDTPATRAKERQARIEHHARQARDWAEAADAAECEPDAAEGGPERGQRFAAISQAHAFASISSVLAEPAVAVEQ